LGSEIVEKLFSGLENKSFSPTTIFIELGLQFVAAATFADPF